MRRWKLALAVALAAGIAVWAAGLHGSRVQPTGLGTPAAKINFAQLNHKSQVKGTLGHSGTPEFSATFSSGKLDKSLWATCFPWADTPAGCTDFGNGQEREWYLPSQVSVAGQDLVLTAQRTPTDGLDSHGSPELYQCRSGMVTSYPGFQFDGGYVQVQAWIPAGQGLWPAIWLAAANEQWPPEIDLLETEGLAPPAAATTPGTTAVPLTSQTGFFYHPVVAADDAGLHIGPISQGWHTVALSWSKTQITWYLDGKEVMIVHQGIPDQPMYLIMDLAEAGPPSTSAYCNGSMKIRSVKVWPS